MREYLKFILKRYVCAWVSVCVCGGGDLLLYCYNIRHKILNKGFYQDLNLDLQKCELNTIFFLINYLASRILEQHKVDKM